MKNNTETTFVKIKYLEELLIEAGCPTQDVTPNALQLLNECIKHGKQVQDIELIRA